MSDFNMNELDGVEAYAGGGSGIKPDAGDYPILISKSETVSNNAKTGTNAAMEYTILGGTFEGVVIKEWLSVVNKSDQAQEIARSKLKAIRVVTKSEGESSVAALVGKMMIIRITKEPHQFVNDKGQTIKTYNNNVINYMDMDRKNAAGTVVAEFVAGPVQEHKPSTSTASGGSNTKSQSKQDIDDDIPF